MDTIYSRRLFSLATLCGLCMSLSAAFARADYVVKDLYTLTGPPDTTLFQNNYPYIRDTAAAGQVAGASSQIGQALLWNHSGDPTDLTPTALGFNLGYVWATNGTHQVGTAITFNSAGYYEYAMLWTSTAASAVDLNPPGYLASRAFGLSANQQVGYAYAPGFTDNHAVLWNSTADSMTDLHPGPAYTRSVALATDGAHQVGGARTVQTALGFEDHAILWTGTAQSFVDINPVEHGSSDALAVSGDQIAGVSAPPGANSHAAVWTISTHSFTDLTPSPPTGPDNFQAAALDTNGSHQVGWYQGSAGIRAQLWSGSPQSAVNLQALLPGSFTNSWATSIDAQGNIYGIATDSNNGFHAIEWSPSSVPEPASAAILLALAPLTLLRRRHAQKQSPISHASMKGPVSRPLRFSPSGAQKP